MDEAMRRAAAYDEPDNGLDQGEAGVWSDKGLRDDAAVRMSFITPVDMSGWEPPYYRMLTVEGLTSCSICAAVVYDANQDVHTEWHRNTAEIAARFTNAFHALGVMPHATVTQEPPPERVAFKDPLTFNDVRLRDLLPAGRVVAFWVRDEKDLLGRSAGLLDGGLLDAPIEMEIGVDYRIIAKHPDGNCFLDTTDYRGTGDPLQLVDPERIVFGDIPPGMAR